MQLYPVDWLVSGLFFGQAMILTVSAGLLERFWLAGVWRSTLLSFILILVSFGFQDSSELTTISVVFFVAPITVLCVASPMLAMRYFCDWRLVPKQTPTVTRRNISTSDFMLAITSVAALIFLTKVSQVAWEMGTLSFWTGALIPMGFLFLLSFLTTVPVVWFFFRLRKPLVRCLCSIAWCFAAVAVTMFVISHFDGATSTLGESLLTATLGTTVFISGLAAMDYSGFCLNRRAKATDSSSNSEVASIEQPTFKRRRVELAWVAATLLLAACSSITLAVHEASKNRLEVELSDLAAQLRSDDGDLQNCEGKPYRLNVGRSTTDELMHTYFKYSSVQHLSLAHSQITDATISQLARHYSNLTRLDLGYTNVTAQSLKQLETVGNINHLGLAGTKIDFDALVNVFKHFSSTQVPFQLYIQSLDLSDTQFTAEQIANLPPQITMLNISNCKFNDDDIATITGSRAWATLNISGNPITGSGIRYAAIQHLIAHDVPLQDKFFTPAGLSSCSLSNTQLTDVGLKACASLNTLKVGNGQFTDQGLRNILQLGGVHELYVFGEQLNGTCLVPRQSQQWHISLSKSSVNDLALAQIAKAWKNDPVYISSFSLADTEISEHGLSELSGCDIYLLDLSRTRVTAQSILDLQIPGLQAVLVDFNQFNADELRAIRSKIRVIVGEKLQNEMLSP
ncbi:MAG: hypothetical protein U0930_07215 [Pirellulales bacterium]